MPKRRISIPIAFVVSLGCATTPPPVPLAATPAPPGLPGPQFQPQGDIVWATIGQAMTPRRAAFDGWRVIGPSVDLIRAPDGLWHGTIQGQDVALSATPGRITGSGVNVAVLAQPNGSVTIDGTWFGAPVQLEVSNGKIQGLAGAGTVELWLAGPGMYSSNAAGMLTLSGEATRVDAPVMPQFFLALLVVMVL
jgi:hypothetical protein